MNMDDTTQSSRLHDYRETSEERADFQRHRFLYLTVETRGEPCPGSREFEKRALDGENGRRALKEGGPILE
ncbi:hypothetical protein TNCV_3970501 [Trichonephila clavipes]|nr:hypothetical protein TNCV_3970501 [Trichonephila clavipes]